MSVPYAVSAQPERLQRFREIGAAVAYALRVRSGVLDTAATFHEEGAEPAYRVSVAGLGPAVIALADVVDDLGAWVGRVGDAFLAADADRGDDVLGIPEATFDRLFAALPPGAVPGRSLLGPLSPGEGPLLPGEPAATAPGPVGSVGTVTDAVGVIDDAIRVAQGGGETAVAAGRSGTVAALLASQRFGRFVTWFAPVATVADAGGAAADRWNDDQPLDLTTADRVGRAAAEAAIVTGASAGAAAAGSAFGRWAGGGAGSVGGPIGAAAGFALGGYVGGRAGEAVADAVLDDEPDPPTPTEVGADVGEVDEVLVDDVLDAIDDGTDPGAALTSTETADAAWTDPGTAGAAYDEAPQLAALGEPPGPRPRPPWWFPVDPRLYPVPSEGPQG